MSNGRTRSDLEFSIPGTETAAAGPEQLAAASWLEELAAWAIPALVPGWSPVD